MKHTRIIVAAASLVAGITLVSCTAQQAADGRQRIENAEAHVADIRARAEAEREAAEARGESESVAAIDKSLAELRRWEGELARARMVLMSAT